MIKDHMVLTPTEDALLIFARAFVGGAGDGGAHPDGWGATLTELSATVGASCA